MISTKYKIPKQLLRLVSRLKLSTLLTNNKMNVKTKILVFSLLGCAVIAIIVIGIVYGVVLNKNEAQKLGPGAIVTIIVKRYF